MVSLTQRALQLVCITICILGSSSVPLAQVPPTSNSFGEGFWAPSSVDHVIRQGHEYEETIGPYSYKVVYGAGETLNWIRAFQKCKYLGYSLLDIENLEELAVVRDFLIRSESLLKSLPEGAAGKARDGPGFWTSGTDLHKEGYYVWMTNGFNVASNLWNSILREPSNHNYNEHCIQVNNRGSHFILNDVPCENELHYICKRPSDLKLGGTPSFLNTNIMGVAKTNIIPRTEG